MTDDQGLDSIRSELAKQTAVIARTCCALALAISCANYEEPDRDTSISETPAMRDASAATEAQEPLSERPIHDPWADAAETVQRLPLQAFADLPTLALHVFEEHGCAVPQVWYDDEPHNIISGEFAAPGQQDWAALCSRNGQSRIVVAWGGAAQCEAAVGEDEDRASLQGVGGGQIGFSRLLAAVHPGTIMRYYEEFGGPEPPLLTHQGINDIFVEKASVVRYCHGGEWLRLTGMD